MEKTQQQQLTLFWFIAIEKKISLFLLSMKKLIWGAGVKSDDLRYFLFSGIAGDGGCSSSSAKTAATAHI